MNTTEQAIQADPAKVNLTNWKNPPTVANLKQDLMDALPNHKTHQEQVTVWLDNLRIQGKAKVESAKGNSRIVPKLIRKQAEWRYPALSEPFLSSEDIFRVSPATWEDRDAAKQNQVILSYQFNTQIDKVHFIDDYVRAAVDEGSAVVKVGWDFIEEEYEEQVPTVQFVVNPDYAEVHQHLETLIGESPSQYQTDVPEELKQAHQLSIEQGLPLEPKIVGYHMETKTRTVKNCPTLEVCDYRNVIIDPTCMGNIDKAGFVIYSFEANLSELEKNGRYKNLKSIDTNSNTILGAPDHAVSNNAQTFNFTDKPRKKFVVYEYWGYWDIDGTGVVKPIVAAWVGDTLIRMEENPFPDKKIPFVIVQYLPVRRAIYGESDGSLLEDNQKIIGAVTRGMIDIMARSANGQMGVRKDALDTTNRRKFDKGMDYEFNPGVDPRQAMYMHTYPEIPRSAHEMLALQNNEAESLTGVKAYSQGVGQASLGNVATAVRGALDAASKREAGILRRLAKGIIQIGRKIISMNSEFLSEEETIRITNEQFIKVKRDDLVGNFDLKLNISTPEADNAKAQELSFMLQTMGNNMDPELSKMILADIATLHKMPDLAHKIISYQPQPDPAQEQIKQLQMQLMQAQIAKETAQAHHYMGVTQLAGAKAQTEGVKQGHIQSDTDLRNLEFLQEESGVKQERLRQLQQDKNFHDAAVNHINNTHDMKKTMEVNKQKQSFGKS